MTDETKKQTAIVRPSIATEGRGLVLRSYDEMWRFALCVVESDLAPKGMNKPAQIVIALQTGLEVGLPPMQALQGIAVINGKATIMGDAALALVFKSGLLENKREEYEGELGTDGYTAVFATKRRGDAAENVTRFSVNDAKVAGLWTKPGPWSQYYKRMLMYRAKGFHFRDHWPDILKGLHLYEEFVGHVPLAENSAEMPTREQRALPQEPEQVAQEPKQITQAPANAAIGVVYGKLTDMMAILSPDATIPHKVIHSAMIDLVGCVDDSVDPNDLSVWTDELADKCLSALETNGLDNRWLPDVTEGVPEELKGQKDG